jgi:hypothetical protein
MSAITQVMLMRGAAGITNNWTYRGNLKTAWVAPAPTGNPTYGGTDGSMYVIAGMRSPEGTAVCSSTDGINWTGQGYLTGLIGNVQPNTVFWTGSYFIIGILSANKSVKSTDGVTWSLLSATVQEIYAIGRNSSHIILGGINGRTSYSTNEGTTWSTPVVIPSMTTNAIRAIVWNGSYFMLVGDAGRVYTSPDGITWTSRTTAANGVFSGVNIGSLAWNGSVWLACSQSSNRVGTSPDGVTWTSSTANLAATTFGTSVIRSAMWDGTKFIIGGNLGRIATSPDGSAWTYNGTLAAATTAAGEAGIPYVSTIMCNTAKTQYVAAPGSVPYNAGTLP